MSDVRLINGALEHIRQAAESNGWYLLKWDGEMGAVELLDGNGGRVAITTKYGLQTLDYVLRVNAITPMPSVVSTELSDVVAERLRRYVG